MKISRLIKNAQMLLKKYGNGDVYFFIDNHGDVPVSIIERNCHESIKPMTYIIGDNALKNFLSDENLLSILKSCPFCDFMKPCKLCGVIDEQQTSKSVKKARKGTSKNGRKSGRVEKNLPEKQKGV